MTTVQTVEELEESWGVPENDYTFEVNDPKGKPMTFRARIVNDMVEAIQHGEKFKETVKMLRMKPPMPIYAEFAPVPEGVAQTAVILHTVLIEPELTLLQSLRWTRQRAAFVGQVMQKLSERTQETILTNEKTALENEKND